MIPRSAVDSRVLQKKTKSSTPPQTGNSSRLYGVSSARVEHASLGGSRRGLKDRGQPTRRQSHRYTNEIASAMELSALKPGSRVIALTAGRDVYEERLCVWPTSGDRWMMASPDGTLDDVAINHLVSLRDVTGKQTYCAGKNDYLPVSLSGGLPPIR